MYDENLVNIKETSVCSVNKLKNMLDFFKQHANLLLKVVFIQDENDDERKDEGIFYGDSRYL